LLLSFTHHHLVQFLCRNQITIRQRNQESRRLTSLVIFAFLLRGALSLSYPSQFLLEQCNAGKTPSALLIRRSRLNISSVLFDCGLVSGFASKVRIESASSNSGVTDQ
jgi:hypothetical protein